MSSLIQTINEFGKKLDYDPLPELPRVTTSVARMTRADVWPAETLAEMRAIWKGERDHG